MNYGPCLACEGKTRLWGPKPDRNYVRCRSCGTVQLDPVPTEAELRELYAEEYVHTGHQLSCDTIRRIRERQNRYSLKLIDKWCPPGPILEVGPGWGFILEGLRDAGRECIGIEPGESHTTRLRELGFQVERKYLEDLPAGFSDFSGVFLSNVFEHLANPADSLGKLVSVLQDDGRVIIQQPTGYLGPFIGRALYHLRREKYIPDLGPWLASPYHIFLVSPPGMKRLCERVGLRLYDVLALPGENRSGLGALVNGCYDTVNRVALRITRRWPLVASHYFIIGRK